tara:strand:+ start:450 stop:953 length:504 start_codon:yes stop_codon:yes gene_type:complete
MNAARHSIVSGARSREMVAGMRDDHLPARFTYSFGGYGAGDFTVRRCSDSSGELSGGVVIHARVGSMGDEAPIWGHERRLRPGWTQRQLERALSTLFAQALSKAHWRARITSLATLADKVVPKLANCDEVTLFSNEANVPECYDEMSLSDITVWEAWLRMRLLEGGE